MEFIRSIVSLDSQVECNFINFWSFKLRYSLLSYEKRAHSVEDPQLCSFSLVGSNYLYHCHLTQLSSFTHGKLITMMDACPSWSWASTQWSRLMRIVWENPAVQLLSKLVSACPSHEGSEKSTEFLINKRKVLSKIVSHLLCFTIAVKESWNSADISSFLPPVSLGNDGLQTLLGKLISASPQQCIMLPVA